MDITNKIDNVLIQQDCFDSVSLNEAAAEYDGAVKKAVKGLKGLNKKQIKYKLAENFKNFADIVEASGFEEEVLFTINHAFGTKFKSLSKIANLRVLDIPDPEEEKQRQLDREAKRGQVSVTVKTNTNESIKSSAEDFKASWVARENQLYKNMTLAPFKKAYLELIKIISGGGGNPKTMVVYALMWIAMAGSKLITNKIRNLFKRG